MTDTAGEWRPDPAGRHQLRWFDGTTWTDQVADGGVTGVDPYLAGAPTPTPGGGGRSKLPIVVVAAVVAAAAVGGAVVLLGGGDDGLDDEALEALADEVVDDLGLPGDDIDDVGIDAFSIDCLVEEADLDDDVVVEDVGPVASVGGIDEDDEPEDFFQLGVAMHLLADAADGPALLEAAEADEVATCLAQLNGFDDDFEADLDVDELGVDGSQALVVLDRNTDFARSYLLVGRVLLNVQAFSSDGDQRDELLTDALAEAQEALREGGA